MEDSNFQPRRPTETHPVPLRAEPVEELWSTGKVDIIVHSLSADGYARPDFKLTSKSQLDNFLGSCRPWNATTN
jgi:hypothetical protein